MSYDAIIIDDTTNCSDKNMCERLISHKIDISDNKTKIISIEKVYNYMISYINAIVKRTLFYDDFDISPDSSTGLVNNKLYEILLKNISYVLDGRTYNSALLIQASPDVQYGGLDLAIAETLNRSKNSETRYRYAQYMSERYKNISYPPSSRNILLTPKLLYIGFSSIQKGQIYTTDFSSTQKSIANIDTIHTILLYLYTFLSHVYKFSAEVVFKMRIVTGAHCIGSTRYITTDGYGGKWADYGSTDPTRVVTNVSPMFNIYNIHDDKKSAIIATFNDHTIITPYREVRDSTQHDKIWYFKNTTTTVNTSSRNTISRLQYLNNLIYIGGYTQQNKTFDETEIEGTNGKFQIFNTIYATDNYRVPIQEIYELFNLTEKNIITLDNIKAAIDFIFDDWFSNINIFNCTYYTCHYNCHGNNVSITAPEYEGQVNPAYRDPTDTITIVFSFSAGVTESSPLNKDMVVATAGWSTSYQANEESFTALIFVPFVHTTDTAQYTYTVNKPPDISDAANDHRFTISMSTEVITPPVTPT